MRVLDKGATHCSKCFQQDMDRVYVDLEAAYDGPVLNGSIKVTIDNLILCENCLIQAAKLIGLVEADDLKFENQQLGQALEQKNEDLAASERTNRNLIETVFEYGKEAHRVAGRPKVLSPEEIEALRNGKSLEMVGSNGG